MNEFTIKIPPLRERKEDIAYLANRFLANTNIELGKGIEGFSKEAMDALLTYDWPGNVRQFRSTIRRGVLLADDVITEKHLDMREENSPLVPLTPDIRDIFRGKIFKRYRTSKHHQDRKRSAFRGAKTHRREQSQGRPIT